LESDESEVFVEVVGASAAIYVVVGTNSVDILVVHLVLATIEDKVTVAYHHIQPVVKGVVVG